MIYAQVEERTAAVASTRDAHTPLFRAVCVKIFFFTCCSRAFAPDVYARYKAAVFLEGVFFVPRFDLEILTGKG